MIVNLAAFLVLQTQSKSQIQNGEKYDSKELDAKTRPIVEIPQFKDMKCVTVSAYRWMDKKDKKLEVTRVFRFTYKADFKEESEKWTRLRVKEGWTLDKKSLPLITYDRDLRHPKVIRQALLLQKGKAVFDAKAGGQTRRLKEDGWVWVSFNETIKDPTW